MPELYIDKRNQVMDPFDGCGKVDLGHPWENDRLVPLLCDRWLRELLCFRFTKTNPVEFLEILCINRWAFPFCRSNCIPCEELDS